MQLWHVPPLHLVLVVTSLVPGDQWGHPPQEAYKVAHGGIRWGESCPCTYHRSAHQEDVRVMNACTRSSNENTPQMQFKYWVTIRETSAARLQCKVRDRVLCWCCIVFLLELWTINRWSCTITEKAPTRAFSWLKAATTAFTFKTLLRHYAKQALTPR